MIFIYVYYLNIHYKTVSVFVSDVHGLFVYISPPYGQTKK